MGKLKKEPQDCQILIGSRCIYGSLSKAALWDALCAVARGELRAAGECVDEPVIVQHLRRRILTPVCEQRGDIVPDPLSGLSRVIRLHGRGSKWAEAAEAEKELW